jgi:CRP/FNR family transcriptional regulator, nitrogen oxide reductase regulator
MLSTRLSALCPEIKSQLLEGFSPADRKAVLAAAVTRRFPANSVIANQGHPADHLYLLTKGRARNIFMTEDGKKLLLHYLGPGEAFGVRALLSNRRTYVLGTEMTKDSSVLEWDRKTIRGLVARYPRLLENALSTTSDFVAWYVARHVALTSHTARQRLAQNLLCLARDIGEQVPDGIEFDVTNEDLASAANITSFTVCRLMSEWQQTSGVVKRRGKVVLRSPEKLFEHLA